MKYSGGPLIRPMLPNKGYQGKNPNKLPGEQVKSVFLVSRADESWIRRFDLESRESPVRT